MLIHTYKKQNNNLFIRILILFILSFYSQSVSGQIFSTEQNPLSVKWRQIYSNGFRIIYPVEMEKEAQRMANTLPYIYTYTGSGFNRKKASIPIVFQSRGTTANGFVQLAPKKSEFYTTPSQQFDSQDWLNNLAIHELRHVAQFDKLTGGSAHPFPEEIYFAWMGASIPTWFFEGDAVVNETVLTQAGRGRQPAWVMPYRTTLLEGKKFSYSKTYLGSDKDVTPGYYQLGYLTVSNIRKNTGKYFFDSLLTDIRKRPLRPYPFSGSLKKFTGMGTHQWFKKTQSEILSEWKKQDSLNGHEDYPSLNAPSRYATNYFLPVKMSDGRILALKESKSETPHFVLIDSNQKEHKLFGIGYQERPWFSYANGTLVWDEIRYDPRYKQRNYSTLCSYNFKTGTFKKLSNRIRVFSPSLSADAKKLVAVTVDLKNHFSLIEMDAGNGKILKTHENPGNFILQTPAYDESGNRIVYISLNEQGKSIWTIDNLTEKKEAIILNSRQQLDKPIFISDKIAFNAHYNGLDNIYDVDIHSKKISALTASKYGAFSPSPDSGKKSFSFSNYGLRGLEVSETSIMEKETGDNHFVYFARAAENQENAGDVFIHIPDSSYLSKPYTGMGRLFNFHSILPVYENENKGGVKLVSDNLLNTLDISTGINYLSDLRRFEYATDVNYKALYPVISLLYRNRPKISNYRTTTGIQQGQWRENFVKLNLSLPLSLNALNHNYNFSLRTATSFTSRYLEENLPASFIRTLRFPMEYGFSFSHSLRSATRDIAPQWAQVLRLTYNHQPFDNHLKGHIFAFESFLYFPGLAKNHSLLASFNYQNAIGANRFATEISTVYGYSQIKALSTLKNTLLFNYRFPFAFPDAEIGPIAYVRNLRGGLFVHYENIGLEKNLSEPKTYGLELRSSMNLLRYLPVFDVGTRLVFVNKIYNQNPILEFNFNYSF